MEKTPVPVPQDTFQRLRDLARNEQRSVAAQALVRLAPLRTDPATLVLMRDEEGSGSESEMAGSKAKAVVAMGAAS